MYIGSREEKRMQNKKMRVTRQRGEREEGRMGIE
jgi:hypothetical protein